MKAVAAKPNTKKSEETKDRILEAALAVFRERGFQQATMREIAAKAGVAVGAAYYYFESKDAIVLAFYERSHHDLAPATEALLAKGKNLEGRLRSVIGYKFEYFAPNRKLMGALSAHADPNDSLSPFSAATRLIREQDIALFEQAVAASDVKLPRRIKPYLPRLLWMYQMGLILFWVYDNSPEQARTKMLFDKTLQLILLTLRFASLSILTPMHRMAADLLDAVYATDVSSTGEDGTSGRSTK